MTMDLPDRGTPTGSSGAGRPGVSADHLAQLRASMAEALAELQQTTDALRQQSATARPAMRAGCCRSASTTTRRRGVT